MKKIKAFYKDRTAKPIVLDGVTFHIKPLSVAQASRFQIVAQSGSADLYTSSVKRSFANDHVESWEGMVYDNKEEVEFSADNAVELLSDESYDDLFAVLFDFAFTLRQEMLASAKKDSVNVKK